jgi:hypothetical protein
MIQRKSKGWKGREGNRKERTRRRIGVSFTVSMYLFKDPVGLLFPHPR